MKRREFIAKVCLSAGVLKLVGFFSGCRSLNMAHDPRKPHDTQSSADLAGAMKARLTRTENNLMQYPHARRKLKSYLEELRNKTSHSCSRVWLDYQNSRLKQINWLVDAHDNGRTSRMRLKMRPYDIPWLIWGIGKTALPEQREIFAGTMTNGVLENVEKVLNVPDVEVEFTDQFADFCYLCVSMDTEGCKAHKEFVGYGSTFPQALQMSPRLKKESDTMLQILELKWNDIVTGKRLLELCVNKASEPADHTVFPLPKKTWDYYRAGINRAKKQA